MADAELVAAAMTAPAEIVPTYYGMLDLIMDGMDTTRGGAGGSNLAADVGRLDARLAALIASGELAAVHATLEAIEGEELARAVRASFDFVPDIDQRTMRAQLDTMRRGLEVRRRAVSKMEVWNGGGRSTAVAAYAALERGAILSIERREVLFEEILARLA